ARAGPRVRGRPAAGGGLRSARPAPPARSCPRRDEGRRRSSPACCPARCARRPCAPRGADGSGRSWPWRPRWQTGVAPASPPLPLPVHSAPVGKGVLPSQLLREAISSGWMVAGDWRIPLEAVQPASVDLRLGDHGWPLRCSFLPDSASTVEEKVESLAFERIDLRDGVTLERDRPYLVPLIEQLRLPADVRARANPKSSTGRLDMFTRVLTDRSRRFDEIAPGYHGTLYLEVVPRTFAIRVKT